MGSLSGKIIGRLTIGSYLGRSKYNVSCECGNQYITLHQVLKKSKGNGCLKCVRSFHVNRTHGETGTKIHRLWICMRFRCQNPNYAGFKDYGGRGITVCEEWEDYLVFKEWAFNNGYAKGLSLDREDVNGNYTPENCRFVTWLVQGRNKRNNRLFEIGGEMKTIGEWSETYGANKHTVASRLRQGRDIITALTAKSLRSKHDRRPSCKNYISHSITEPELQL